MAPGIRILHQIGNHALTNHSMHQSRKTDAAAASDAASTPRMTAAVETRRVEVALSSFRGMGPGSILHLEGSARHDARGARSVTFPRRGPRG